MPDALVGALTTPGLPWLLLTALIAGGVYGFAGFGAALVFMPLAVRFVPPELAVSSLAITALSSFATVVPKAWARCDKAVAIRMIGVAVLMLPLGVLVLRTTDPTVLRWAIVAFTGGTLLALLFGWRRTGEDTPLTRGAVAGLAGFAGGAVGLNGPILVLFHLSGRATAEESRANTIVFLSVTGLSVLPVMALYGLIDGVSLALGMLLALPYGLGALTGQAFFVPGRELLYRRTAYVIIAFAVILGLPIWGAAT